MESRSQEENRRRHSRLASVHVWFPGDYVREYSDLESFVFTEFLFNNLSAGR